MIFSRHAAGNITIPFLDVSMEKWNGTEIVLLLAFVFVANSFCLKAYAAVLEATLKKSGSFEVLVSHPPSALALLEMIWKPLGKVSQSVMSSIVILGTPLLLVGVVGYVQISSKKRIPGSWAVTSAIDVVLAGLSIVVLLFARRHAKAAHECYES